MQAPAKRVYASVYLTEGREWINLTEWGGTPDDVRAAAEAFAKKCPHWARDNRFVRVAMVKVEEV